MDSQKKTFLVAFWKRNLGGPISKLIVSRGVWNLLDKTFLSMQMKKMRWISSRFWIKMKSKPDFCGKYQKQRHLEVTGVRWSRRLFSWQAVEARSSVGDTVLFRSLGDSKRRCVTGMWIVGLGSAEVPEVCVRGKDTDFFFFFFNKSHLWFQENRCDHWDRACSQSNHWRQGWV